MYTNDELVEIPIDIAQKPETGQVFVDQYYVVRNNCIVFWKTSTCLQNMCLLTDVYKERAISMLENIPGGEIKQIHLVYLNACARYYRIEEKLKSN